MKENSKIELELSEEQLHEITGGCDKCDAQMKAANDYITQAVHHHGIADHAAGLAQITSTPQPMRQEWLKMANEHAELADWHIGVAQRLQTEVINRHPSPPSNPRR
jgi:hypothetical protein